MKRPGRRAFLRNTGLAITAAALSEQLEPGTAAAQTPPKPTTDAPPDLTQKLSHFIVTTRYEDLPEPVRHEAKRTLLNWVGCAIGGAPQETVGNAIAALAPFTESRRATLFGRTERMDALNATLVNGISSHVLDFDDTHAETGIHPAAPIAPAILALAEQRPIAGATSSRRWSSASRPSAGSARRCRRRITRSAGTLPGTTGVFGSAAATGRLLGLDERQTAWALGLAAAQPVGLQEMFGSMTKSFHPGKAAQNGLTAALFARARLHRLGARARGEARLAHHAQRRAQLRGLHQRELGHSRQQLQAVRLRPRRPSGHRRLHRAARSPTISRPT